MVGEMRLGLGGDAERQGPTLVIVSNTHHCRRLSDDSLSYVLCPSSWEWAQLTGVLELGSLVSGGPMPRVSDSVVWSGAEILHF